MSAITPVYYERPLEIMESKVMVQIWRTTGTMILIVGERERKKDVR